MLISHKYKFIFIHNPRTGGTSIRKMLYPCLSETDIKGSDNNPYYFHSTALELQQEIPSDIWNSYFKFVFVRNPWDKAVSQYYYFSQTGQMDRIITDFHAKFNKQFKDFNSWLIGCCVDYKQKQNCAQESKKSSREDFDTWYKRTDLSWFQNINFTADRSANCIVDFVGRYENINEDVRKILEKIGLKADLQHENKATHNVYRKYYNTETNNIVKVVCNKDIDVFGYRF